MPITSVGEWCASVVNLQAGLEIMMSCGEGLDKALLVPHKMLMGGGGGGKLDKVLLGVSPEVLLQATQHCTHVGLAQALRLCRERG